MKKSILFIFGLIFNLVCVFSYAQEIKIDNISIEDEFPLIKLKIQQRNPKILKNGDFTIKENDSVLPFTLDYLGTKQSSKPNQKVLILVENLNHKDRLLFYKEALKNGINNLKINYKINIAVFDRVRNNGTQTIYLLLNEFTNNKNKLLQAVDKIQPKNDVFSNNKSSDLYHAVYESVNLLQNEKGLKTILLLSTAFNNKWSSHTSSESSKAFSIKHNIPIYSLQYRKQGFEHHKLTDLVLETYGVEKVTNSIQEASLFITEAFKNLNNRLGNEYLVSYNSTYNKDGKTHKAIININDESFSYIIKTKNIYKWLYYGATLLLALILFFYMKKSFNNQQKKNKEKLALLDEKIKSEKKKNEQILQNLNKQEAVIKQFKTEEDTKKYNEDIIKKEEKTFVEMKTFGSLPIIQYNINGNETSFIIKKSVVFIGRAPTNDIILLDKHVSREHAKIIFEDGYFIIDLNSAKGTFVNNLKVDKIILNHGNIIKLGNTTLTFIL